jgi:hypothetical protein
MPSLRLLFLAALAAGLVGCAHTPIRDGAKAGPFFEPSNVLTASQLPANIRRVLLLPLSSDGLALTEDHLAPLDATFLTELTRTARFEIVTVSRGQLAQLTGLRQVSSTTQLPPAFLDHLLNIYNEFAADGILFVDLTTYSPYPPLTVGVRTKLAHVRDSQILWASDLLFSAADPLVANSARRHALRSSRHAGQGDLSHTILQNPTRFAEYVAATTFATLPQRTTTAATQSPAKVAH